MKRKIHTALFLLSLLSLNTLADSKPFKRTLILPGGGFKTPMHLATYHAMVEEGIAPDLIIGICGGAVAAAVIEMFPDDLEEQKRFILSREFYGFIKELAMDMDNANKAVLAIGKAIIDYRIRRYKRIPDIFNNSIYRQTKNLSSYFNNKSFESKSGKKSFSTIITATKMKVRPEDVGKLTTEVERFPGDKTFQEVYFTDKKTAKILSAHKKSQISTDFKSSPFVSEIDFITDVNVYHAARASITDPFLFNPLEVKGHYMLTGASNVLPINYFKKISNEVHYYYKNGLDTLLEYVFTKTFKTSMGDLLEKNSKGRKDFLMTDDHFLVHDVKGGEYNLTIEPGIEGISVSDISSVLKAISSSGKTIKIQNRLPTNYYQYVKTMRAQYKIAKGVVSTIIDVSKDLKGIYDPLIFKKESKE